MKIYFGLLCLLLLATCGETAPPAPEPTEVAPARPPDAVKTGPLPTRTVTQNIVCTGTVEVPPTDLISVHARTSGQVSQLKHLPGDYVRKGTQLLRISNPELIHDQRTLLETKAQLAAAARALERQTLLESGQATTAEAVDLARSQVALLQATYGGMKVELERYGIDVGRLESEGIFQTSVGVYAAGSGYVHSVTTNQGQAVTPTDELLRIADTDHLHLELDVPARDVAAIRQGQRVEFLLPFNNLRGTATVAKINPMVDAETATLNVHCHFEENLPEGLVPGLFLNATLIAEAQTLTGLPSDGTVREGDTFYGFRSVGGEFEKTVLRDARVRGDFVTFAMDGDAQGQDWVLAGAYYFGL